MLLAVRWCKLLEVCLTTHKGCFMSDSSFVVKLALIKIMIKPAELHYTKGTSAKFVGVRNSGGAVLTKFH